MVYAANNIRLFREAHGWSLEDLAGRVEGRPHFTTLAKLERSERALTLDWMIKIAAALGVTAAALIPAPGIGADAPFPRRG